MWFDTARILFGTINWVYGRSAVRASSPSKGSTLSKAPGPKRVKAIMSSVGAVLTRRIFATRVWCALDQPEELLVLYVLIAI